MSVTLLKLRVAWDFAVKIWVVMTCIMTPCVVLGGFQLVERIGYVHLVPWKWKQQAPPKRLSSTRWYSVRTQEGQMRYLFVPYATDLRVALGSNPVGVGGGDFLTSPDWPRGPPSFLYGGYRVCFSGVNRLKRGVNHPPASSAETMNKGAKRLPSPYGTRWPLPLMYSWLSQFQVCVFYFFVCLVPSFICKRRQMHCDAVVYFL
jgi:hypothetical protein